MRDLLMQRARILMDQNRHDLAEKELRQVLAVEPDNGDSLAMLATCLLNAGNRERLPEAEELARRAIFRRPDWAHAHSVLAWTLFVAERFPQARQAIDEAIRLDPQQASYRGLLAAIYFATEHWRESLSAAEQGLGIDPEEENCLNFRAMALSKLGRGEESSQAVGEALRQYPQSARVHANQGWVLLHQHKHKEALKHFQESLRIDPESDWARSGLVEALKAHNPIYRFFLAWSFWLLSMSGQWRLGIIIGLYVVYQVALRISETSTALRPWIQPLLILYVTFVILTWVGQPLFNLILRLNRYGRHALSRRQRVASNWFAGMALVALALLGVGLATDKSAFLITALYCGLMILPVNHIFETREPARQRKRGYIALALGALAATAVGALFLGSQSLFHMVPMIFNLAFIAYMFGTTCSARRPKV